MMNTRRIRDELKDKYRIVQRTNNPLEEDEIRISAQGRVPKYVYYASVLLNEHQKPKVTIKATGIAIASAISITENLKRRIPLLHQSTVIGMAKSIDVYEPIVDGLDQVTAERDVPCVEITLTKFPNQLDTSAAGYQPPIDQSLVSMQTNTGSGPQQNSTNNQQDHENFRKGGYRGRRGYRGSYKSRGGRYNYYENRGGRGGYRGNYRQY